MSDHRARWRIAPDERLRLDRLPTDHDGAAPTGRDDLARESEALVEELAELQNRLWAEGRQSLLLVLQALDAGGKDGTVRKVFTGVNPQGVTVTSFKQPSAEELSHDFLWRIHHHTPHAGSIAVFNRSHYEDVLVARVDELVPRAVWEARYRTIREFERSLVEAGTQVVKVYLHLSAEEQARRFQARLDQPHKRWKFSRGDLAVRAKWDAYREAYTDAIEATTTVDAPWYVVPADDKKLRNWIVLQILVSTLGEMDPRYPEPADDLDGIVIT